MSLKIWFNNVDQTVVLNIMSMNQQYFLLLLEIPILVNLKQTLLDLVWILSNGEINTHNPINIILCTKKTTLSQSIVIRSLMEVVGPCFSLMLITHMKIMKLMKQLFLQNQFTEDLIKIYKILDFKKELILLNLDSGALPITKNMEKNKRDICIGKPIILILLKLLGMVINCK